MRDMIPGRIFHFHIWEPNNSSVIAHLLKEGDVFIDVGANIGYYSIFASKLVGPSGRVVAIEASPEISKKLKGNVILNETKNIRMINEAASDHTGFLDLFVGNKRNTGSTTTVQELGTAPLGRVAARPLPDMLTEDEIERATLVKIDVEGAEAGVVRGILGARWRNDLKLIVEINPEVESKGGENLFTMLRDHGFLAYAIDNEYTWEWYFSWTATKPPTPLSEAPTVQTDVLFSRVPLQF